MLKTVLLANHLLDRPLSNLSKHFHFSYVSVAFSVHHSSSKDELGRVLRPLAHHATTKDLKLACSHWKHLDRMVKDPTHALFVYALGDRLGQGATSKQVRLLPRVALGRKLTNFSTDSRDQILV
jgi:hypothetical protein